MLSDTSSLPFVSVIIPVFDVPEVLRPCLEALDCQSYPRERFEVIVVDNGAPLALDGLVGGYRGFLLEREQRPGSYVARNAGIRRACGDIIAFTDADCRPREDWIERGVAWMQSLDQFGMVGGNIEAVVQKSTVFGRYAAHYDLQQEIYMHQWHFAATANLFTTRATIERMGMFNETLFSGGDAVWGKKVFEAGLAQCFAEDVVVRHMVRTTMQAFVSHARRVAGGMWMRNRAKSGSFPPPLHPRMYRQEWDMLQAKLRDKGVPLARERRIFAAVYLFQRIVIAAEWARLSMGGKPVR